MSATNLFEHMHYALRNHPKVGNARVCAVIKFGGTEIFGYNSRKSHPFAARFAKHPDCIYLHAEVDAIKNYLKYTRDIESLRYADLYIMRLKNESRNGPLITGLSLPCEGCQRAIVTFGINRVFYTENDALDFTCIQCP
jgi:deoxycytidylate deaminase